MNNKAFDVGACGEIGEFVEVLTCVVTGSVVLFSVVSSFLGTINSVVKTDVSVLVTTCKVPALAPFDIADGVSDVGTCGLVSGIGASASDTGKFVVAGKFGEIVDARGVGRSGKRDGGFCWTWVAWVGLAWVVIWVVKVIGNPVLFCAIKSSFKIEKLIKLKYFINKIYEIQFVVTRLIKLQLKNYLMENSFCFFLFEIFDNQL